MTASESNPLVLGSASPRRREILTSLGVPIRVVAGDVDESKGTDEGHERYLERVVHEKLAAVAERLVGGSAPGILVADTIVVVDDHVLGKPRDVADARRLLGRLAGRTHIVRTRYAISLGTDPWTPKLERTVETRVTMRGAGSEALARYAATGEGLDKAGAYAAQGLGAFLIERIEGSFSNVVGLPACEVVRDLIGVGLIDRFPMDAPTSHSS